MLSQWLNPLLVGPGDPPLRCSRCLHWPEGPAKPSQKGGRGLLIHAVSCICTVGLFAQKLEAGTLTTASNHSFFQASSLVLASTWFAESNLRRRPTGASSLASCSSLIKLQQFLPRITTIIAFHPFRSLTPAVLPHPDPVHRGHSSNRPHMMETHS